MKVSIHDIRKSKGLWKEFDFEGNYRLSGVALKGPLKVQLKLTNAGSRIVVEGSLEAPIELECSRCGEAFRYNLETDVEEHFLPAGSDEAAESPAGVLDGVFTYQNDQVVLDEVLRQEIEAAMPMQAVCQSSCKGLCSGCGANMNRESCQCPAPEIDPRWAGLLEVKSKKEKR